MEGSRRGLLDKLSLKRLRNAAKILSQENWYPGRNLKPAPPRIKVYGIPASYSIYI
jgi:hypothetical protein